MGTSAKYTNDVFREIVIFEKEIAKNTHKALFSLNDDCYQTCGKNILQSVLDVAHKGLSKLHIAVGWESILKVAIWTSGRPLIHEVIALIKKTGVQEEELRPFQHADINDIFPWLYYSNRFDILRKICSAAKSRIESKIDSRRVLIYCHMVSYETETIVASNL